MRSGAASVMMDYALAAIAIAPMLVVTLIVWVVACLAALLYVPVVVAKGVSLIASGNYREDQT